MNQIRSEHLENHTNKTYQERMNQTASSKFRAIAKHLGENVKLLDFGSGFSPEFIKQVTQTRTHYVAYDVSQIVQSQLQENNIDFVTHNDITQKTSQLRQGKFSYLAASCLVTVLETVMQLVRYDSLHTELVSFNSTISKFN